MEMAVIETKMGDDALRKTILAGDRTFAPMGSGGYGIREREPGIFILSEQDCMPAQQFFVRIKNGRIWSPIELSSFFGDMLATAGISFLCTPRTFASREELRHEFDTLT